MNNSQFSFQEMATALTAIYTVINLIARITPTPKDDQISSKIGKVLNLIFLWSKTK